MNSLNLLQKIQQVTLTPLHWCVILIGLFVPISVVPDNILLAFILLGALFNLRSISRIALSHPVARSALMLFLLLIVAMSYGITPLKDAFHLLMKYVDLMFIPIFIFLFSNDAVRRKARYAFLISMAITLVLSYLVGLHILPIMSWMDQHIAADNPVIFHSHITQNNFMAFAVFLSLLEWREASSRGKQIAWMTYALLGTINIVFMVYGRTGYLVLMVLIGWFLWTTFERFMHRQGRQWAWRQKIIFLLISLALPVLIFYTSPRLHDRVMLAVS